MVVTVTDGSECNGRKIYALSDIMRYQGIRCAFAIHTDEHGISIDPCPSIKRRKQKDNGGEAAHYKAEN